MNQRADPLPADRLLDVAALELLKEMLKDKDITEDDNRRVREKIEGVTKEYLERLDKTLKAKEEEVLSV